MTFTPADKKRLREWLNSPETQTALTAITESKPSVFIAGHDNQTLCAHRLHEIRGWEMCVKALNTFFEAEEKVPDDVPTEYGDPPFGEDQQ